MKTIGILSVGLAVGFSAQAALVKLALSPPGTGLAVGLSPSNEVPQSATSKGSGGEISGGILYDTVTSTLQVAVGYGSAAGFSNLTGVATGMHIHGPAAEGTNAGVLVSLVPYSYPAANPTNGGVIFGTIHWPTNQAANLLAGLTYLNIHTASYTNGEIRGQLIPMNVSPAIVCPDPATFECGSTNPVTVVFTDPEGDALAVLWTLNGVAVQTNMLPARPPGLSATASLSETWPVGTNVVGVAANDIAGNTVSCSTLITVESTNPPVILSAHAEPNELWPPNHKMVNVVVTARVTNTCGATTWKILSVRSNQSSGRGSDWVITGDHTLQLRAERDGNHERIYSITIKATGADGDVSATKVVTVTVPHDQGKGHGSRF